MSKQQEKMPNSLNLVNKPLSYAVDGHAITIRDDSMGELVFFQITGQKDSTIQATGLSSIRMTLDQLKGLNKALQNTIQDHENKQKDNNRKK